MKTPREILLQRHESGGDKLDAVRKNALAAAFPQPESNLPRHSLLSTIHHQFSTLCQLKPQAWAGLAAVWILIFALKLATHDESHVIAKKSPMSREVVAELRRQKLFFAELIGLRETRDAEPPKIFVPRPRSERRFETLLA
jgi:hypothetical protein